MNKVSLYIFGTFVLFTGVFVCIGGSFGRQFWLSFLPGLMANLAILALAVLVIDSIFKRQNLAKLEETNASQSRAILFFSNAMAYFLLEYLELASKEEVHNDVGLNLQFALERLRVTDLAAVFYQRLMHAQDKEAFVDGFEKILREQTERIARSLNDVYPRPDPGLVKGAEDVQFGIGALGAFKSLFGAFREANARVQAEGRIKQEQLDLLIKVSYQKIGAQLRNMQDFIIKLSDSAKASKLFMSLD